MDLLLNGWWIAMTKNKESTRYYSDLQENYIAKKFGGRKISNSGAGLFNKGDVVIDDASMVIECKTSTEEKKSFSVKEEWLEKQKKEAFENRIDNTALAFNFGPNKSNYFVISQKPFFATNLMV